MSLLKKPPGFSNSVSAISMSVAALVLPMTCALSVFASRRAVTSFTLKAAGAMLQ